MVKSNGQPEIDRKSRKKTLMQHRALLWQVGSPSESGQFFLIFFILQIFYWPMDYIYIADIKNLNLEAKYITNRLIALS